MNKVLWNSYWIYTQIIYSGLVMVIQTNCHLPYWKLYSPFRLLNEVTLTAEWKNVTDISPSCVFGCILTFISIQRLTFKAAWIACGALMHRHISAPWCFPDCINHKRWWLGCTIGRDSAFSRRTKSHTMTQQIQRQSGNTFCLMNDEMCSTWCGQDLEGNKIKVMHLRWAAAEMKYSLCWKINNYLYGRQVQNWFQVYFGG